jgi:hydrogenase expression/formation protein HypC
MSLHDEHGLRFAKVRFGGVLRNVCLEYEPDAAPGDYVLVHVGFAIARIDAAEAERAMRALEAICVDPQEAPEEAS